jgi:6-phosphofructokinase 1
LGSSRGGFDAQKIVDAVVAKGINQMYVIGGDGTHRGISVLCE